MFLLFFYLSITASSMMKIKKNAPKTVLTEVEAGEVVDYLMKARYKNSNYINSYSPLQEIDQLPYLASFIQILYSSVKLKEMLTRCVIKEELDGNLSENQVAVTLANLLLKMQKTLEFPVDTKNFFDIITTSFKLNLDERVPSLSEFYQMFSRSLSKTVKKNEENNTEYQLELEGQLSFQSTKYDKNSPIVDTLYPVNSIELNPESSSFSEAMKNYFETSTISQLKGYSPNPKSFVAVHFSPKLLVIQPSILDKENLNNWRYPPQFYLCEYVAASQEVKYELSAILLTQKKEHTEVYSVLIKRLTYNVYFVNNKVVTFNKLNDLNDIISQKMTKEKVKAVFYVRSQPTHNLRRVKMCVKYTQSSLSNQRKNYTPTPKVYASKKKRSLSQSFEEVEFRAKAKKSQVKSQ